MCLAVYKPADVLPDWAALEEGFNSNKDGAGFAAVSGGKLIIQKGFFSFDQFREAYKPFAELQSAVHFRWATHGKTDVLNCHPFQVTDDIAMIHNGVLPIQCNVDKNMSDTWHYVHHILQPMAERDPDFFTQPEMVFLGSAAIKGSKFVFLRSDGEAQIWNEDDGHWSGDIWYSNESYKCSRPAGFRRWWKDEEPVTYVLDDSEDSQYRDFLSAEQRWAFDDLLQDGYSVQELDCMVKEQGPESLTELVDTLALGTEDEV